MRLRICRTAAAACALVWAPAAPASASVTFSKTDTYSSGGYKIAQEAIGDVNGDGHPDILLVANSANGQGGGWMQLWLNDGTGKFPASSQSLDGALTVGQPAIADLNGDGRLDVAVGYQPSDPFSAAGVLVQLQNASGGLDGTVYAGDFAPPRTVEAIAAGDLNHDGHPDLVTASDSGGNKIGIYYNNGDGTFPNVPQDLYVTDSDGNAVGDSGVVVADFNGDGWPDIASRGDRPYLLLNQHDGSFFGPVRASGGFGDPLAAADLDGDGKPDLVTGMPGDYVWGGGLADDVLLGDGTGGLTFAAGYGDFGATYGAAVADLTGDGIPDLATANRPSGQAVVYPGLGDGSFGDPASYAAPGAGSVAAGDLDGDGHPDLVLASGAHASGDTVTVLLTAGGHGTNAPPSCAAASATTHESTPVTVSLTCHDQEGDPVALRVGTPPAHGSLSALDQGQRTVAYAPAASYVGDDSFTVVPSDATADGSPATVSVTVLAAGEAPPPPPSGGSGGAHIISPTGGDSGGGGGTRQSCARGQTSCNVPVTCSLGATCNGDLTNDLGTGARSASLHATRHRRKIRAGIVPVRFKVPAGKTRKIHVRLDRAAKRLLARRHTLRVPVKIVLHGGGRRVVQHRVLYLRMPRHHRRGHR